MLPTVRILDPADNMKKFSHDKDPKAMTVADYKKFIDDFQKKALKPFFKSQDIPTDNTGPVKVLVAK
jgi:hypothetical protein